MEVRSELRVGPVPAAPELMGKGQGWRRAVGDVGVDEHTRRLTPHAAEYVLRGSWWLRLVAWVKCVLVFW